MEDSRIVALYFARNESALTETQQKYSHYLHRIAHNILQNEQDAHCGLAQAVAWRILSAWSCPTASALPSAATVSP